MCSCTLIDHYSRYLLEARYYLHEDFAVLRFGFRRVLLLFGAFTRLYIDNGPSFHTGRFHAACKNQALDIQIVHSKPYISEGRGCCERFNRTIKDQFESEVRALEDLLTLDELNARLEAWVAERYHRDIHSETRRAPGELFAAEAVLRSPPDLETIDELLRLRKSCKVHRKWTTVEVAATRYVVNPSLRGRRVHALYDPFDPSYVLIEHAGAVLQRAYPQCAGQQPPELEVRSVKSTPVDYTALLLEDFEKRRQQELLALDLRAEARIEFLLPAFEAELAICRSQPLSGAERSQAGIGFRKLRPLDPSGTRSAFEAARRRLGTGLHLCVYLEDLEATLVRTRTKAARDKANAEHGAAPAPGPDTPKAAPTAPAKAARKTSRKTTRKPTTTKR